MSELTPTQKLFAINLIDRPGSAFKILTEMFDGDKAKAMAVYEPWMHMPEIKKYQDEFKLISTTGLADIDDDKPTSDDPEKDDFVADLKTTFENTDVDPNVRIKYAELIAKVKNYIPKPDSITNVNVAAVPPVMIVNNNGSDGNWENQLAERQDKLMDQSEMPVDIEVIDD